MVVVGVRGRRKTENGKRKMRSAEELPPEPEPNQPENRGGIPPHACRLSAAVRKVKREKGAGNRKSDAARALTGQRLPAGLVSDSARRQYCKREHEPFDFRFLLIRLNIICQLAL